MRLLAFVLALVLLPLSVLAQQEIEIFVQKGHSGLIQSIAVSKDGAHALTGGSEKKLVYWRIRDRKEIRSWDHHSSSVDAVAISPDGQTAISASNTTVKVWNLGTGKEIRTLPNLGSVSSIAFSPDGQHVLMGHRAGALTLLYVSNWRPTFQFDTQSGGVWTVAYSPNGKLVASGHNDSTIKLWDSKTGDLIRTFAGHKGRVARVAFTPDGQKLVSGAADKTVRTWDVATAKEIRTWVAHDNRLTSVEISPDGLYVATASLANTKVRIWDINTGREVRSFDGGQERLYSIEGKNLVNSLAYTPDGKALLAGSLGATKIWDTSTGIEVGVLAGSASGNSSMSRSPDGKFLVNASWSFNERPLFHLWSLETGRGVRTYQGHENPINFVTFSPDGQRLLTASDDKTLKTWDFGTGAELKSFVGHTGVVLSAAYSPDGTKIISSSRQKSVGTMKLWDANSGTAIRDFTGKHMSDGSLPSAFLPDGRQAIAASQFFQDFAQDGAKYIDLAGNDITSTMMRHSLNLYDINSGSSVNTFYAGRSASGYLFDIKTAHGGAVTAATISPDGQFALTGALRSSLKNDNSIRVWDIKSGKEVKGFDGHVGYVTSLAYSPDGLTAVSSEGYQGGASELLIKHWDIASGKLLNKFAGHTDNINSVVFNRSGSQIISTSMDTTSRVWDVASGAELVQHIRFSDGEWISLTPSGYFVTSSVEASKNVNIRIGMSVYGIDQFYDVFYRPDIVEAALAGKDTSSLITLTINQAIKNPPPVIERVEAPVSSASNAVKFIYRIKSTGGGIGDVRVFHNGKLVKSDGVSRQIPDTLLGKKTTQITDDLLVAQMRNLAVEAIKNESLRGAVTSKPKPDVYESSVEIEPVPGENDISVVAFNAQNSIQSITSTTQFISRKPPVAPRLHILAVGVDHYKDKSASLVFAVKDSQDISARWKAQAANIYGAQNIFVETVSDAQAGREGILAKINQMAARVKPTDHFVLFIASHGVLLGDQYYMVTSDYDGKLHPSKLIGANEIVDASKRIKALSQLYILDTCHAGGIGGVVSGLYDARVSVLAKKMGLHIFASASSSEEAIDGFEGNGLFTHTLLTGLNSNKNLDLNLDKKVSLIELGSFSKDQTRKIAKTQNHKQDPLIINFGQDNPVYLLQ